MYFKMYICNVKLYFQHHYSSLQCHILYACLLQFYSGVVYV